MNKEQIEEFSAVICDQFCKYSGTGDINGCEYMNEHGGKCPLDVLNGGEDATINNI